MARTIGVDLGTTNTYIYRKGRGVVVREPSAISIDEEKGLVVSLGEDALDMLGRERAGIFTYRPIKDGVIADFDITTAMLQGFFEKAAGKGNINRPNVVLSVTHGITEVERRALEEAAREAGARSVSIIEAPFAAALGAGLPIEEPRGSMIVNIGGGTTEIAVMSLGGVVEADSVRVGGDEIDEAVNAYIKRKYNLIISDNEAEELKRELGTISPDPTDKSAEVQGRDSVSGLPAMITVTSEELKAPILEQFSHIIDRIKLTLEKLHPELAADIHDHGITVSGGGALLDGLPEYLSKLFGFEVRRAENPLDCCVEGIGKAIEIFPDIINLNTKK